MRTPYTVYIYIYIYMSGSMSTFTCPLILVVVDSSPTLLFLLTLLFLVFRLVFTTELV